MKKVPAIFFYLLLLSVPVFSQRTIKGQVINAAGSEPISGSSVFISSTTVGVMSNDSGYFELNNIPAGRHELVISSIGYETNVFSFSSEELPLQVKVEMSIKVKELENVVVEPYVEEGWARWGMVFIEKFIGFTPNAKKCKIKNEKSVHFKFYKKSNRIIAYSDEPLVIENKALGYTIHYQLEQFEVDFRNGWSTFAGYPLFVDMDKNRKGPQRRWQTVRDKAFYGSIMHFIRSLYRDSLLQNGFELRRMIRRPNFEKQRVISKYGPVLEKLGKAAGKPVTISPGQPNYIPRDSMQYLERVMQQKDHIDTYGSDLLTADSVIVRTEGVYKTIYFTDYLYITYKGEMEDKEYLGFPYANRNPDFQHSFLWLPNLVSVTIDLNGNYYPPQELTTMDYWGWSEKIADTLPSNYMPGN
jgi:CarboxypepD_reg-like domain